MAQYRKKPVVIEAVQWNGVEDDKPQWSERPAWLEEEIRIVTLFRMVGENFLRVNTMEGWLTAQPGDWIIRGVKGEVYPCKPDIFEATYERG